MRKKIRNGFWEKISVFHHLFQTYYAAIFSLSKTKFFSLFHPQQPKDASPVVRGESGEEDDDEEDEDDDIDAEKDVEPPDVLKTMTITRTTTKTTKTNTTATKTARAVVGVKPRASPRLAFFVCGKRGVWGDDNVCADNGEQEMTTTTTNMRTTTTTSTTTTEMIASLKAASADGKVTPEVTHLSYDVVRLLKAFHGENDRKNLGFPRGKDFFPVLIRKPKLNRKFPTQQYPRR